jgi:hypothetical protein
MLRGGHKILDSLLNDAGQGICAFEVIKPGFVGKEMSRQFKAFGVVGFGSHGSSFLYMMAPALEYPAPDY